MLKQYSVNFKSHFNILQHTIIKYIILIGGYLFFFGLRVSYVEYYYVFIFLALTDILPFLFLHVTYCLYDQHTFLTFNSELAVLTIKRRDSSHCINLENIQDSCIVSSYGFKGSRGWYAFAAYHYCTIYLKDGSSHTFTCLLVDDIEDFFRFVLKQEVRFKFKLIAFLKVKSR